MKNGLVSAYTVQSIDSGILRETLFFIDGSEVFEGIEQNVTNHFKSRVWVRSDKSLDWLDERAEFIGTYPRPNNF
jgi:hypothetical protein